MHRNTRKTLQRYYERGLLADPPPRRSVDDIHFDFLETAERRVYEAVGRYIERRFRELESEKPGKGFVMTIYRRRASSSPQALERSLERRREGLLRVIHGRAFDSDLAEADVPDSPSHRLGGKVNAYPLSFDSETRIGWSAIGKWCGIALLAASHGKSDAAPPPIRKVYERL